MGHVEPLQWEVQHLMVCIVFDVANLLCQLRRLNIEFINSGRIIRYVASKTNSIEGRKATRRKYGTTEYHSHRIPYLRLTMIP